MVDDERGPCGGDEVNRELTMLETMQRTLEVNL
jgi:hypothetical protein